MSTHLVSIITPAYNASAYITETINSVLLQTYTNWEMIIADDESTDDTLNLAMKAASSDPRIIVKSFPRGGNPAITRNRALKLAKGEYIAFLDSDDLWETNKLEIQMQRFSKTNSSWSFSNTYIMSGCDTQPSGMFYTKGWRPDEPFFDQLLTASTLPCLTVIMHRDLLKNISHNKEISEAFNESADLLVAEDWDLWLRASRQAEPDYISSPLATYRVHSEGISRSPMSNYLGTVTVINSFKNMGVSPRLLNKAKAFHLSKLAISRMLNTKEPWRNDLFRSSVSNVLKLRNIFLMLLCVLPTLLARRVFLTLLSVKREA